MVYFRSHKVVLTWAILLVLVFLSNSSAQYLDKNYYSKTCPNVFYIVRHVVSEAIQSEARMGASLFRLHFHDCFVNGCDGSVLLDDTATFTGEKNAIPNINSLRGFEFIDQIKESIESECPGVVSCADILAIVARDSLNIMGGPTWDVKLGRRDGRTASKNDAFKFLPPPTLNLSDLIKYFQNQGLSEQDLVVLSGAHTIGQARCINFRDHIYNDTNVNPSFAQSLKLNCKSTPGQTDNFLAPLDVETPKSFDNHYFVNLAQGKGLLHTDQQLVKSSFFQKYLSNPDSFYSDFGQAMLKMGDIKPLTGSNGEIRKNCRRVN